MEDGHIDDGGVAEMLGDATAIAVSTLHWLETAGDPDLQKTISVAFGKYGAEDFEIAQFGIDGETSAQEDWAVGHLVAAIMNKALSNKAMLACGLDAEAFGDACLKLWPGTKSKEIAARYCVGGADGKPN